MSAFPSVIDLTDLTSPGGFIFQAGGYSVASAGDINGDGFDDLIVGAPSGAGSAYVIFGKATGFANINPTNLVAAEGFIILGDAADDGAGHSVASAGDVNGDGFDDLIIGAPYGDNGGNRAGEAYVIFGKDTGFAVIDLGNLAAADGFIIQGYRQDGVGCSVASAGDVNGDGFDDIIVGALDGGKGGKYAGEAYVIFGKATGFTDLDLNNLAATDGFTIEGDARDDLAGRGVASAGDVNGDGFDDLIVGAPKVGKAYVIFGKATGFADIDLSTLTATDGFIINGLGAYPYSSSVASAGDVNGDGFADLILGAPSGDTGPGTAYVIFGKATGFSDISFGATSDGFTIIGDAAGDLAGRSVASAGDVNGDGFDDLIVGAPLGDNGGNSAGEAYVIFGKATGFAHVDLTYLTADDGFIIQGDVAGDLAGFSVASAGDVNGDGLADLIIGAPHAGEAYVIFGNTAPVVAANEGATVLEGSTGTVIAAADLAVTDANDAAADLTFTITTLPISGTLRLNGTALALDDTFTQANIAANLLTYDHNGSETITDSFGFSVADATWGSIAAQTFDLTITPGNDAPVLTGDLMSTVDEGGSVVIGAADLGFTDPDDGGDGVIFNVSSLTNGVVQVNNATQNEFTGTQLAAGQVTFLHNGSETVSAGFQVSVEDGNEDSSVPTAKAFSLTVTPVNDAPVLSGDLMAAVNEGGSVTIGPSDLGFTDPDDHGDVVLFTVWTPVNGFIQVNNIAQSTFTGTQLTAGQVVFVHDGSQTTMASFDVTVEDGNEDASTPVTSTFNLTVTPNLAPTAVTLTPVLTALDENSDTIGGIKVADLFITDDGLGTNVLDLTGADAASFEFRNADNVGGELFFIGPSPDFETKSSYDVTVTVDDAAVDATPDATDGFTLTVNNISPEFLFGTAASDALIGGTDVDIIRGFGGKDYMRGGSGNDIIRGGSGADRMFGDGGNDRLFGGGQNDFLRGGSQNDLLRGENGNDRLFGDNGADRLFGGNHNDLLRGGNQNDLLRGENGNDRLFGDGGNDLLIGGLGRDIMNGGAGRDRFDYDRIQESRGVLRDRIDGFQHNVDDIDLRTIDANTTVGGNQRFKFIGDDAFSRTAGELHIRSVGNITKVEGDINGDGRADFTIDVTSGVHLTAGDFLL